MDHAACRGQGRGSGVEQGEARWSPTRAARLRLYGGAICLLYLVVVLAGALSLARPQAVPPPINDFIAFHTAGGLALSGRAAEAYDAALFQAAQREAFGGAFAGGFFWLNPPSFFPFVAPFAPLPFLGAWLGWSLLTALFLAAMLRLVVPGAVVVALMAAPGVFICAFIGQNGMLTAGLMAGCLALLERRPRLAGVLLGLLTVKPQLGLLFPALLLLGRRWVAILAATATALALAVASALWLGLEPWAAFLGSFGGSRDFLAGGAGAWSKLQSPFALAVQATGSLGVAAAVQEAVVAGLLGALAWLNRHGAPAALQAAALVAGSALATPYLHAYDAPLLSVAAAFLLRDGLGRGMRRAEVAVIAAACLAPAAVLLAGSLAVPSGAALLLLVALRRGYVSSRP